MPNEVYNLGRAVGMSAWEVYARQSLLLNPDIEPLSEREWLAQSIGMGTSMLLKISKEERDLGVHYLEFPLPSRSLLGAPNTIIGSFFFGEATYDEDGWCNRVTDYGPEIANDASKCPEDGAQTVHFLPDKVTDVSDVMKRRLMQYIKIQDAIVLQDGVWSDSETSLPKKTFVPDITKPPVLRITFQSQINEDFYLLLTGFANRAIVKGEVGFDMGSVMPDDPAEAGAFRPENGDFLGPTLYPWANKVVFTYPAITTYLIHEGLTADSKNIKITVDLDDPETLMQVSPVVAGLGVQVDDPSTLEDPAKPITVSARIKSANKYVQVVDQSQFNTTNGTSQIPTTLQGSEAQPAAGVGITQPTTAGQPHIIGAKIAVDNGAGHNYLGISQSSPNDANQPATILVPAYADPGPGIGVSAPRSPGSGFKISSKVESEGDGSSYIKVQQKSSNNAEEATTILTPSKAVSGRGIGISQPSSPGQKHIISALMETEGCGSNYLGVTQNSNENRLSTDVSTTLTPSKISSRKGISITQPDTPGGDVVISSIMESKGVGKNYLKIEQEAHDSGCGCGCGDGKGADTTSTVLSPSRIIPESDKSRIVVTQPSTPGGDVKIGTKITFTAHPGISIRDDPVNGVTHIGSVISIAGNGALGMDISQGMTESSADESTTTLFVSKHVVDKRNQAGTDAEGNEVKDVLTIKYPSSPAGDIVYFIDVDEIIRRMLKSGPLHNFINDLLNKIFKGDEATVGEDGHITWPSGTEDTKIPLCNLNIYSDDHQGEDFVDCLRSRPGNTPNDLRMK